MENTIHNGAEIRAEDLNKRQSTIAITTLNDSRSHATARNAQKNAPAKSCSNGGPKAQKKATVICNKAKKEINDTSANDNAMEQMDTAVSYLRNLKPGALTTSQKRDWSRLLHQVVAVLKKI